MDKLKALKEELKQAIIEQEEIKEELGVALLNSSFNDLKDIKSYKDLKILEKKIIDTKRREEKALDNIKGINNLKLREKFEKKNLKVTIKELEITLYKASENIFEIYPENKSILEKIKIELENLTIEKYKEEREQERDKSSFFKIIANLFNELRLALKRKKIIKKISNLLKKHIKIYIKDNDNLEFLEQNIIEITNDRELSKELINNIKKYNLAEENKSAIEKQINSIYKKAKEDRTYKLKKIKKERENLLANESKLKRVLINEFTLLLKEEKVLDLKNNIKKILNKLNSNENKIENLEKAISKEENDKKIVKLKKDINKLEDGIKHKKEEINSLKEKIKNIEKSS